MASVTLDIKQWGNNLGVRLPAAVAKAANLHANQRVRVAVEDGRVIITPEAPIPMTLEQRLATYDVAKHGGEVMATDAIGTEKW